ncbi:hypothetical protein QLQ15_12535 [Lysobacter sp. LF1]|uniref:Uncharacterized protein n=1 Tax=Lysobacter stagni TaxID=3045172 RepID=A0ABT6XI58_9GAMM|nr:hypothetical protein [Lysobacter sp. LF1]MDI9239731.1 hypothetical protein [Lysobacter sp. LF1]
MALLILFQGPIGAVLAQDADAGASDDAAGYFATTPQLDDALTPLKHLPPEGRVSVRTLVAIVPDARETRMGKSFDMMVASLLTAYQSRGYALDGFAFSWTPRGPDQDDNATARATSGYRDTHRSKPSLLLFRREDWRSPGSGAADASRPANVSAPVDVVYELVFLVGDSPSFGVQPRAFEVAARCALALNGTRVQVKQLSPATSCDRKSDVRGRVLNVMGPTFSGSMQSLAVAIGRLVCDGESDCVIPETNRLQVNLVSPSASVPSNRFIGRHSFVRGATVTYRPLSWTLREQMLALTKYLCGHALLPDRRIVFLVEESTFGGSAKDMAVRLENELVRARLQAPADREALQMELDRLQAAGDKKRAAGIRKRINVADRDDWDAIQSNCPDQKISVRIKSFSPNIASIRAEHSRLRKAAMNARQRGVNGTSRLLELDMTSAESGNDLPPVFQPSLTSRSDELMLYRLFDTLRIRGEPNVVVIVATDVRDRLFLLSEVRKELPSALPVMLEADYLMVHPDYRATSRGAIVVPAQDPLVCVLGPAVVPCPARDLRELAETKCVQASWRQLCVLRRLLLRNRNDANRDPARNLRNDVERYSFSTDLAANTFRAVYLLAGYQTGGPRPDAFMLDLPMETPGYAPTLLVATMAGFESLDDERRSTMVAADARLGMQRVWYLATLLLAIFFLLVGVWLLKVARSGGVMSNFVQRVILDSRWLTRLFTREGTQRRAARASASASANDDAIASLAPPRWGLQVSLVAIAGIVVILSGLRLLQVTSWGGGGEHFDPCLGEQSCRFSLAHGRDIFAVLCIGGLYACMALIGIIRLCVAGRRYDVYGQELGWPGAGESERPWLIPVSLMLLVVGVFFLTDAKPISIDGWEPWLFAMVVLICGATFLVTLGWHMRNLGRLTLRLSRCIPSVQKRKGLSDWPSPQTVQQPTQTAFNLSLSRNDVRALRNQTPREWLRETQRVIGSSGLYPPTGSAFDSWQSQLVAELKLLVVAIRLSAWCAMAAPLAVLLMMSAYPPVYTRWLKAMSIALLLVGFLSTTIVVLRLEKDTMLGPMFTRHGDDLSFGGALRALWPKFVAMAAVLIPLVLPDAMDWLNALIRSINSLG